MIKKSVTWCKENIVFISVLGLFFGFQLIYVSNATVNVPVMDYWRYINNYVDKCFMGGITFNELYESYAGHKSLLTTLLFVINVTFFKLNVRVSTFFASVVMICSAILIYNLFLSNLRFASSNERKQNIIPQVLGALIIFPIFNLNQWEILCLEFATPFMLRILITIAMFLFTEKLILNQTISSLTLFPYAICLVASTNLVFAGYSFAFIAAIFLAVAFNFFINKNKASYITGFCIATSALIGLLLYFSGTQSAINSIKTPIKMLLLNSPKGILVLLSSSVFHENLANETLGLKIYYIVGFILLLIYLAAVLIYLKKKYYKFSYIPVMLICYAFCNMGCMYISRFREFGLNGMVASRYTVDTTLGLIGVIWIFSLLLFEYIQQPKRKFSFKVGLCVSSVAAILLSISLTNMKEQQISVYRCAYFRELVNKMENIEMLPDEELNQYQANSPEMVRNGVQLMKKYHLGIYKHV